MLRIVYESHLPTSVPVVPVYEEQLPENVFRRSGGGWQVRFKGRTVFTVLPWLGATYIHHLLTAPDEARPAVDIVCRGAIDYCDRAIGAKEAIDAGLQSAANPMLTSLGDISDWKAVKDYRDEATECLARIARARADNNNVDVQQLESDMAMIVGKINEAVGIRGKLKQAKRQAQEYSGQF